MPLTAVKPSQIRKIAANSLVGNNTGAEARGTSLSASQVRTLLGLGTGDSVTFDIVTATTSVQAPLINNPNAAALTLGNSTYGVTVPGAITTPKVTITEPVGASATPFIVSVPDQNTYAAQFLVRNTNKSFIVWMDNSGDVNLITDNALIVQTGGFGNTRLTIASTGAATFSGAVNVTMANPYLLLESTTTGAPYVKWKNTAAERRIIMDSSGGLGIENTATSTNIGYWRANGYLGLGNFYAGLEPTAQFQTSHGIAIGYAPGTSPTVPTGGIVAAGAITASGQLTNATGTITASTPATFTQTWNSGAVTFTGLSANFTDTASASGSMLLSIQKSASDRITTTKHGLTTLTFDTGQIYTGLAVKGTNGTTYWNLGTLFESGDSYVQLRAGDAFAGANHGGINLGAGYVHILGGPTNRTIKTYNGLKIEIASLGGSGSLEVTGGSLTTYAGRVDYSVTKTANYTLTAADYCVIATANSFDFTLPTAVGVTGTRYELMNSGAGVITLKTTSAQTISGAASAALTLDQYDSMIVRSDGANWLIVSQYP